MCVCVCVFVFVCVRASAFVLLAGDTVCLKLNVCIHV